MNRNKTTIASAAFAVLCLLSSARLVVTTPTPARVKHSADEIAKHSDQRFAAIRNVLPQRGVVGYVGDPGTAALGDYYLAQYALTPLVVDRSSDHPLVVGNFRNTEPPSEPPEGLHLVKDFGDGVLLFAGKDDR